MSLYSGEINQSGRPNGFGRAVSFYDSYIMINEGCFKDGHQMKGKWDHIYWDPHYCRKRWGRLLVYHDSFTGPWKRKLEAIDKLYNFSNFKNNTDNHLYFHWESFV